MRKAHIFAFSCTLHSQNTQPKLFCCTLSHRFQPVISKAVRHCSCCFGHAAADNRHTYLLSSPHEPHVPEVWKICFLVSGVLDHPLHSFLVGLIGEVQNEVLRAVLQVKDHVRPQPVREARLLQSTQLVHHLPPVLLVSGPSEQNHCHLHPLRARLSARHTNFQYFTHSEGSSIPEHLLHPSLTFLSNVLSVQNTPSYYFSASFPPERVVAPQ